MSSIQREVRLLSLMLQMRANFDCRELLRIKAKPKNPKAVVQVIVVGVAVWR